MPIKKSIFNCDILAGQTRISKVYVGNNLVYEFDYNVFVFTIEDTPKTIKLQEDLRGDIAIDVTTDWGDGTKDKTLEHTYTTNGTYEVKTRYCVVDSNGVKDADTINYFTGVKSISEKIKTCAHMFDGCSNLINIDCANWNTSKIEDLSYMFYDCPQITNLNCNGWDISNVKTASYMFGYSKKM